jgi:hypothetical protein
MHLTANDQFDVGCDNSIAIVVAAIDHEKWQNE